MNKVLVVDDNDLSVKMIQQVMSSLGYIVIAAFNGLEGVKKAIEERPNLIFMDIKMPALNGTEAMKQIKELPTLKDVPVIAYTANSLRGDCEKFLAEGFDDYLSKPVSLSGLLEKTEKHLRKEVV